MHKLAMVGLVMIGLLAITPLAAGAQPAQPNEVWIPGLASFLIPGLGQLMNGQTDKAVLHFGVDVAIVVGGYYLASMTYNPYSLFPNRGFALLGLAHLAWSLYSEYDAYTVAKEKGFTLGLTDGGLTLSYNF